MPTISVVIPSYNHEKYIAEAIQSVLDQTYKNIEVIVVDGPSSDDTEAVVKRFTGRITYIQEQKAKGAGADWSAPFEYYAAEAYLGKAVFSAEIGDTKQANILTRLKNLLF